MPISSRACWSRYILPDYSFVGFSAGSRVVDVGFGPGAELEQVANKGCRAFGVEVDPDSLVTCKRRGLIVVRARAEALPFRASILDGLICKAMIPYTDEGRALSEFARILKPHGTARSVYHGLGYYVRYLMMGPGWRLRFYGFRSIVNTWFYAASGWRLPGFLGDTLYQTRGRLGRAYRRLGFRVMEDTPSPAFLGLPVFIYQKLEREERPSLTLTAHDPAS